MGIYKSIYTQYAQTTRQILGRTTVPAGKLRNLNVQDGTAEVHMDGKSYEAILDSKAKVFVLTGDYEII